VPPIPLARLSPLTAVKITAASSAPANSTVRAGWIRWIQAYPKMASSTAGNGHDDDPDRDTHRPGQVIQRLGLHDLLGRQVADVQHDRRQEYEDRAVEPELAPGLDHLRYPEPRALQPRAAT